MQIANMLVCIIRKTIKIKICYVYGHKTGHFLILLKFIAEVWLCVNPIAQAPVVRKPDSLRQVYLAGCRLQVAGCRLQVEI